jgi:hypothetical protein
LVMRAPDPRHSRRSQAEIPLIGLSEFGRPPLSTGYHGFIDDKGTFTTIDAPGASYTDIAAINAGGEVAGYYDDSTGVHGFTATPTGNLAACASVTVSDLLTSQGAQISKSDLLPGSSLAISGQSAQGRGWSCLGNDPTGGSFGGLAFAGMTDTTIQVMHSNNTQA